MAFTSLSHTPPTQTVGTRVPAKRVVPVKATATPVSAALKAGDKIRVKESVVVYHVPKTKGAATELLGMEGEVASRADDLNGVYISANLEVRIKLLVPDDPKEKTFLTHVKEDEVELI